MTWGYLNHLLLLVSLTLIHPSEQGCNENFDIENWFSLENPLKPVALIRTNNSMDVMECSLERMCIETENVCPSLERKCKEGDQNACISVERVCLREHLKVCYILPRCFERQIVSQISEKCKGENYTSIQMLHFMCWLAKAADTEKPEYCSDYGYLCQIYSEMSFPPRTDQTTLPPTTNATTPPESTTIATTTATLPLTTTTTPPESTTITTTPATLPLTSTTPPESTTTTKTTTTLQTATTKTSAKVTSTGNNSGHWSTMQSSQESLTLKVFLMLSLVMNFAGPLLVYLYMRRRPGPMVPQNGMNGAPLHADAELQSTIILANTTGNEEAFLMQPPSSSSQA